MDLPVRRFIPLALWVLLPTSAVGQQISDDSFRFDNPNPAFEAGRGPTVCIDEGHFNFHTADGRYKAFAELLRSDGYRVEGYAGGLTTDALRRCGLLVIANALAQENENEEDWSYPHPSAFSGEEIRELMTWVRAGGRFLLFADHAPLAAAAHDLAAVFGVIMTDVYVDRGPGLDVFRSVDGTLVDHPIRHGRVSSERVDSLVTFTGQALQITQGWEPLIRFGPYARAAIDLSQGFQEGSWAEWPQFSVAGWVHGAAREWDAGRVVFLGEAAMCSAQVAGPERRPMGMNQPLAKQNPQYCLNVVRWLTGVVD
jgi:hypothetical protein